MPRVDPPLIPMLIYCAASLLHFAHNAVFIFVQTSNAARSDTPAAIQAVC